MALIWDSYAFLFVAWPLLLDFINLNPLSIVKKKLSDFVMELIEMLLINRIMLESSGDFSIYFARLKIKYGLGIH